MSEPLPIDWHALLMHAVQATSQQAVAERLRVSRATVSLVMRGKYPASSRKIAARVLECYGRLVCPHLGQEISLHECRQYAHRPAPTSSPREMRHWRACHVCPHRPTQRR